MPNDSTIASLASDLTSQAAELMRNEFRLARAETVESLKSLGMAAALGGAALAMGSAAMTLALLGVTYLLALAVPFWVAALIMAIVGGVIAYALINSARKIIASKPMQLQRTRQQISQDISLIKEGPTNELRH